MNAETQAASRKSYTGVQWLCSIGSVAGWLLLVIGIVSGVSALFGDESLHVAIRIHAAVGSLFACFVCFCSVALMRIVIDLAVNAGIANPLED